MAFTVGGAGVLVSGLVMLPAIIRQLQRRKDKRRRQESRRQASVIPNVTIDANVENDPGKGDVLICSHPLPI